MMPNPKNGSPQDHVGLVHMPKLAELYPVEYTQCGGFGPFKRNDAFAAIKQAGNIGRIRPDTVWVQQGEGIDRYLNLAIKTAQHSFRIAAIITKTGSGAAAGWGVYYQYGRFVIVEHTSDPQSIVIVKRRGSLVHKQLPHFHIEQTEPDSIAATRRDGIFEVRRAVRMGSASPLTEDKPTFNHHLYYDPDVL